MVPIFVMAGNSDQFKKFRRVHGEGPNSFECPRMRFLSSRDQCRGFRDASLIYLEGAEFNEEYDQQFFDTLFLALNTTSQKLLTLVVIPKFKRFNR